MTGIVNKVAGEHEEEAFDSDGVAEEGGVGAFLNVLEVGTEGFEAMGLRRFQECGGGLVRIAWGRGRPRIEGT